MKSILLLSLFLFALSPVTGQEKKIVLKTNQESLLSTEKINIKTICQTENECRNELKKVSSELRKKGFVASSIDSIKRINDTLYAYLYIGSRYKWGQLSAGNTDEEALIYAGFREKIYRNRLFNPDEINTLSEKLLRYYENRGYPFASVKLEHFKIQNENFSAEIQVEKNKLYRIDSILIKGDAKISPEYLYNYINIRPGDIYKEDLLEAVDTRLREIAFIEPVRPAEIVFTENQCLLFLYLKKKKSSQFNGIFGVLPDNKTGKITITGDARVRIKNGFGKGELIDLNWRKLSSQVQDLKINFNYPFLFKSPFGTDLQFKLFKKDSTFLELQRQAAIQYYLRNGNFFKVFIGKNTSDLLSPSMFSNATVLPAFADVDMFSYGIGIKIEKLDYRLNPRSGISVTAEGSAGNKKIRINPALDEALYANLALNSAQLQGTLYAEAFIPVLKRATVKIGANCGFIQNEMLFTNELYRIGGIRTFRGFNEESLFASAYAIGTAEFRFLLDRNSALYLFYESGWYERNTREEYFNDLPYSFGSGVFFQTKAGVFSLNYALGSEQNNPIQLRGGKIHFGFLNYF